MNTKLKQARETQGLTQRDIAKRIGVSLIGYQRYEYEGSKPRVDKAFAVADALGIKNYHDFRALWSCSPT